MKRSEQYQGVFQWQRYILWYCLTHSSIKSSTQHMRNSFKNQEINYSSYRKKLQEGVMKPAFLKALSPASHSLALLIQGQCRFYRILKVDAFANLMILNQNTFNNLDILQFFLKTHNFSSSEKGSKFYEHSGYFFCTKCQNTLASLPEMCCVNTKHLENFPLTKPAMCSNAEL